MTPGPLGYHSAYPPRCDTCYRVGTHERMVNYEGYLQMYCELCSATFDLGDYMPSKMPTCDHSLCACCVYDVVENIKEEYREELNQRNKYKEG